MQITELESWKIIYFGIPCKIFAVLHFGIRLLTDKSLNIFPPTICVTGNVHLFVKHLSTPGVRPFLTPQRNSSDGKPLQQTFCGKNQGGGGGEWKGEKAYLMKQMLVLKEFMLNTPYYKSLPWRGFAWYFLCPYTVLLSFFVSCPYVLFTASVYLVTCNLYI